MSGSQHGSSGESGAPAARYSPDGLSGATDSDQVDTSSVDAGGGEAGRGDAGPSPLDRTDAGAAGSSWTGANGTGVDGIGSAAHPPQGGMTGGAALAGAVAQPDGLPSPALADGGHDRPGPGERPNDTAVTGRRVSRPGSAGGADGRDGGRGSFLRELPVLVLVAFLLALLIKTVLVQAFWIPSESMERTLLIDDRVLVNKVVYRFRDVHRGEIVVFNGEGTGFGYGEAAVPEPGNFLSRFIRGAQNLLGLGAPSEKDFIKRVIGVGGDTVACCDDQGRVTVNGQPLDEPYVYENDHRRFGPVTVPEGQLWVMGDHRAKSSDSRQNGTIPEDKVVGRAFVRVWPVSRFGLLSVPDTFSAIPPASPAAADVPAAAEGHVGPAGVGPADVLLAPVAALALPALTDRRSRRSGRSGRRAGRRPAGNAAPRSGAGG